MTDLAARLDRIVREDPILWRALVEARAFDLPDWWIVSGAIYNTVWNHLTGQSAGYGIKDIDLFYFDPETSYEAEDREIMRGVAHFSPFPPVEIRNQARVHLWYEDHFGQTIAPLTCPRDSILGFASETHAVGVRLEADDRLSICAPFGLEAIFHIRMVPNRRNGTRQTHDQKAARCKTLWPEITVEPWCDDTLITRANSTTDWDKVHALLQRAFAYMDDRIDPPSSLHRMTADCLASKAGTETCLLALDGSALLGCVFCAPKGKDLYVGKLAVEPTRQGNGIGGILMHHAAAEARAFGHVALTLQTRVELYENHAVFARLGFTKIGETAHADYDHPTSITMRREL